MSEYDIFIRTRYPSLLQTKGFNIINPYCYQYAYFLYDYYENKSLSEYISDKNEIYYNKLDTEDYMVAQG